MTLDEALIIAGRMEADEVISTSGMALRILLRAYENECETSRHYYEEHLRGLE